MKYQLGMMLGLSALMIGPALAQNQPTPAQAAAKTLLQAADKATGASTVKSWSISGTGWMGYPGQQFAQGDLPRTDLKNFAFTADLASKSSRWEYVRVQGNNIPRGGGAGFPVQGELSYVEGGSGNLGWNVNPARPDRSHPAARRRRSPAQALGPPGRLHPGGAGGQQRVGHRPVFLPTKPHSEGRRVYDQGLRRAAAVLHPPGDRRVQQRQHARAGGHLVCRPGHGRQNG